MRLKTQLAAVHEQVRALAGRLIAVQETERARIARDLHDDLSQKLARLAIGIDRLATDTSTHEISARALKAQVAEIVEDVHRLSHALHPSKLEALGLVSAIEGCCSEVSLQGDIDVRFTHARVPRSVSKDVSLCLYRIVQEALTNVVRHSGARVADVAILGAGEQIELRIADQGRGFEPHGEHYGLGLVSMRERVRCVGGRFIVRSSAGIGTSIVARVPVKGSLHSIRHS